MNEFDEAVLKNKAMTNAVFSGTPQCKSRLQCVECRNNDKFLENLKSRYGDFKCPLGIELGTNFEKMPDEVKQVVNKQKQMAAKRDGILKKASDSLDYLFSDLHPKYQESLMDIHNAFFKGRVSTESCENSGDIVGVIDQNCCGGKITKVNQYICSVHERTTEKNCQRCGHFTRKMRSIDDPDREFESVLSDLRYALKQSILGELKATDGGCGDNCTCDK